MRELINKEDISTKFTFHFDNIKEDLDMFFCKCGHKIELNRKEAASEMKVTIREGNDITDFSNLFGNGSYARINLKCDACNTDFSTIENSKYVQEANKEFMESYCFQEDDNTVRLIKQRFLGKTEEGQILNPFLVHSTPGITLSIIENQTWIRFNKDEKKLYYKSFNEPEIEITLDKVMSIVKVFFSPEINTVNTQKDKVKFTERLFDVHLFIDRMANFVSDSKNINIIDELMTQMVGKAGLDIIEKVASIFFGIICYSNLSTIALTKGTVFLYDMMNDCHLPNVKELSDNGATSPIKIFNYLVNYKNLEIIEEFKADNKETAGYVFRGKGGIEMNLKYDSERFEKDRQINKTNEGEIFIKEELETKNVSPYIFNKIIKFSDYKTLIKYTKFISYNNLIELIKKYDARLLVSVMNMVEMRNGVNLITINQTIHLAMDAVRRKAMLDADLVPKKTVRNEYTLVDDIKYDFEAKVELTEEQEKRVQQLYDFSVLRFFDFTNYDDSLRMILALRWDPNKEFFKIKTLAELEEYHNDLQEHFNLLTNEEKNKDFINFVRKYEYLETYSENENFKVRVIKTPELLLEAAKEMRNCSGSYVNRVSQNQYLLCLIDDIDPAKDKKDPPRFMLGLRADKNGILEFDQVKAACNIQGGDRFKKEMMKYLEAKDISYKELSDLRLSTSKNYIDPKRSEDVQELLERLRADININVVNPRNEVQNNNREEGQYQRFYNERGRR
jgi:hypothetical protein